MGLKQMGAADSWYEASVAERPSWPSLQASISADVVVLGGGFTGVSSALHLAEAGLKVVLLEARQIGFGASGRNGGQMINSYSRDLDVLASRYGQDTAQCLADMAFEGGQIIRRRVRDYGIDCDLKDGAVFAALNTRQLKDLEHKQALWQRYGYASTQLLDAASIANEIASERYVGGLLDAGSGHIHPLKLVLGEAKAFTSLGGQIFENSPVISIERGKPHCFRTPDGDVRAEFAVIAGNAYLGEHLLPPLVTRSMPCGTHMVATEVLSEAHAQSLIRSDYCVEDCNYLLDYYRLVGDAQSGRRLIYGGGVHYGVSSSADLEAQGIRTDISAKLTRTFPQLEGVAIDYAWSGDFLLTLSRMPQFGRIDERFYYMQGYSGHGVCSSHLAGALVAEAIAGQSSRFDAFAGLPHMPFPGGRRFRVPLSRLGAFFYALRDRLGF